MDSLYRKYRPQTFDDVVGQSHIVSTLKHAVEEEKVSHAYLFCGPRGTGKTTMARILAKAMLCDQGKGHLPDGTCEECLEVAQGTHPDVKEIDAASNTGVDNVRDEIIASLNFAPVRGRSKIYIIDEVHMLTAAAFNALLKTLEEPPEHVLFILCTTDPQMVPQTILSRVQRFDFRAISNADIVERLKYVCEQEGFTYTDEALELIARHSRGGMRDALSTLEQISVFGASEIRLSDVRDLLGSVSSSNLDETCEALATRDVAKLFSIVEMQVSEGQDLLQFVRELTGHIRNLYVARVAGDQTSNLFDEQQAQTMTRLADEFGDTDRIARVLDVLGHTASEMRFATDQRLLLEIAFTRLARPESDMTLEALAERVALLEAQLQAGVALPAAQVAPQAPAPVAAPAPAPTPPASAEVIAPEMPAPVKAEPVPAVVDPVLAATQPEVKPAEAPVSAPVATPAAAPRPAIPQNLAALNRVWREVIQQVFSASAHIGQLLVGAEVVADDGEVLQVKLPQGSSFGLLMLQRMDVLSEITPVVNQLMGTRVLNFAMADSPVKAKPLDTVVAVPKDSVPQSAPVQEMYAPEPEPQPAAPVPSEEAFEPAAPVENPAPVEVPWEEPVKPAVPEVTAPEVVAPNVPVDGAPRNKEDIIAMVSQGFGGDVKVISEASPSGPQHDEMADIDGGGYDLEVRE